MLKKALSARGLTYQEVATQLGLSKSSVCPFSGEHDRPESTEAV
jgi:transcriptional regulator with XRE-family HTH domain